VDKFSPKNIMITIITFTYSTNVMAERIFKD